MGRALAAGGRSRRRLQRAIRSRPAAEWAQPRIALPEMRIAARSVAYVVPALILASGVTTAIGAQLLADAERRATATIAPRAAPVLAAERNARARATALATLRPLFEGEPATAALAGIAAGLPADARVAWLAEGGEGGRMLGLLVADPDRLRGLAVLRGYRQTDQRRDPSGRMLVVYQASGR